MSSSVTVGYLYDRKTCPEITNVPKQQQIKKNSTCLVNMKSIRRENILSFFVNNYFSKILLAERRPTFWENDGSPTIIRIPSNLPTFRCCIGNALAPFVVNKSGCSAMTCWRSLLSTHISTTNSIHALDFYHRHIEYLLKCTHSWTLVNWKKKIHWNGYRWSAWRCLATVTDLHSVSGPRTRVALSFSTAQHRLWEITGQGEWQDTSIFLLWPPDPRLS